MSTEKESSLPLWTRDFTIITLGSVVSMLGNALSGFAMSLMVLDISGSTLLYAVYIVMYTLPQLFVPIISGALLDRFSRKKTIYIHRMDRIGHLLDNTFHKHRCLTGACCRGYQDIRILLFD